jgi:hypothetical protein
MSAELRDLRAKITAEADQVLEALSRSSGTDKSALVREILSKWAADKLHEARLILRLAESEGISGESQGVSGK